MSKKRSLNKLSLLVIGLSLIVLNFEAEIEPIRAAIIPHHLVASSLMEDLGERLKQNNIIPRLIIIGPNHDEVGEKHLITDSELLSGAEIEYAPTLVAKDHACYAPKGVLDKYLSKTKFECVLISSRTNNEEIGFLAKLLATKLAKGGVLVASVDFSHYQTLERASENDLITQDYLDKFNSNALLSLGNDFLDSPRTIAVLFEYLKIKNITDSYLIMHSNSANILDLADTPSTTSYFEYIYY